jgi:aminoglycoside phosphotransferase (APT) family kinase protein
LSFAIPQPLAMGKLSDHYPWNWSIYRWIEGQSANSISIDSQHLQDIALQLGQFLNELHKIDTKDAPLPGLHNYWRGAHPSVYDEQTRESISTLKDHIDANAATACWEKAVGSKWDKKPVWSHGDFASGNILISENKLAAIIDFGCMGIGDPACDLVIAWTFLNNESRKIFKSQVDIDSDTWERARGWALWKACFELVECEDKTSHKAIKQIITEVINEFKTIRN